MRTYSLAGLCAGLSGWLRTKKFLGGSDEQDQSQSSLMSPMEASVCTALKSFQLNRNLLSPVWTDFRWASDVLQKISCTTAVENPLLRTTNSTQFPALRLLRLPTASQKRIWVTSLSDQASEVFVVKLTARSQASERHGPDCHRTASWPP